MFPKTLLICISLAEIVAGFLIGRLRWSRLDIVDVYAFIVTTYFGVYTFLDVLANGAEEIDPDLAILAHLLIALSIGGLWVLARWLLPKGMSHVIQIRYLVSQWANVGTGTTAWLVGVLVFVEAYAFKEFGFLSLVSADDLDMLGVSVPYWFSSMWPFILPLSFCLFVAGVSAITKGKAKRIYLLTLPILLVMSAMYGRRAVVALLVFLVIILVLRQGRNLFSFRYAKLVVVMVPLLLLVSNLYQVYRNELLSPQGIVSPGRLTNVLDAAFDWEKSRDTFRDRMAIWRFNYLILHQQTSEFGTGVPYGRILAQAVMKSIPSVFWPEKPIEDLDELVAEIYQLPVTDYPTNDFAMYQGDFGYLSVLLFPLVSFAVLCSIAWLMIATKERPLLFLFVSGFFVYYLINVERGYEDIFLLYRNVLLMSVICITGYAVRGLLVISTRHANRVRQVMMPIRTAAAGGPPSDRR